MRLGISTKVLRDFSLREAIEVAHEFGYQEIEFWVDDLLTTDISVEEVIHLTDTYGIGRSVHLLTEDLNLASFNESIRQESVRQEMEGLRLAARLGARTATLHPGRKTAKTRKTEEAWHQQLLSIDALAQCAEDCGVTLCVEAMERLGGEFVLTGTDLDYIHTALGRKELAYTLDIAHLHTVGDVCEQLELARHLPVKNVHISQSKGTKPHLTLFDPEGEIDFRQALEKLGEFYDGTLIIEGYVAGKGREIAEKSMKWYRRITANQEEKISQEGVISMATIRGFSVKDSIDVAVKSGCSGIEIQTDYLPEAESERAEVFAYARQQGLYVSLHGPSSDINISSLNRGIRQESIRQIKEAIRIAKRYAVEKLTIHPGLLSSARENVEDKWQVMLESVREIAECAKQMQVHVGIENMEKRKKELVYTISDLNRFAEITRGNPYFGVTLDFCHFATNGIFSPELDQLQLPVKNVHVSQCVEGKPHYALDKDGQIDFANVSAMLRAIGYKGSITMEIKSVFDYQVYSASRAVLNQLPLN